MRLDADEAVLADYLGTATTFWEHSVIPAADGDPCILVELFPEDLRVVLRNLTIANALRRFIPAQVVLVTGWDRDWHRLLWTDFDVARIHAMASAFGVSDVVEVAGLLNAAADGFRVPFLVLGRPLRPAGEERAARPGFDFEACVTATALRLWRAPRLRPGQSTTTAYLELRERSRLIEAGWSALFATLRPIAFVTSHVDYNQWGLAVETARRFETPVLHVQQTGGLKAYTLWPEHDSGEGPFRSEITREIGELFEKRLWPLHEQIRTSADLVAHRSKHNLGRPSWWRSTSNAWVQIDNATQRRQLRSQVAARFGWDPDLPVLTVFNHAVSDALGTNRENFADLAAWFEQTAEYASEHSGANWLFLDHPAQAKYDETSFFDALASTYASSSHLAFRPSEAMSKNAIWCLTDLGVTVRGSVSNELPAYGIPALQAGWSEWSACGLSLVATDEADYWRLLESSIETLRRDEPVINAEQVDRARLWMWFYRSGADVVSPLSPHWENLTTNEVLTFLQTTMRYVESDGDALFAAVRRMWNEKEPLLSGLDLRSAEEIVGAVAPPTRR